MPDDEKFEGTFEQGRLPELLRELTSNPELQGYLEIRHEGTKARIWIKQSSIIAAQAGGEFNEDALREILHYEKGSFTLTSPRRLPPRCIYKPTDELLRDCLAERSMQPIIPSLPHPSPGTPGAPAAASPAAPATEPATEPKRAGRQLVERLRARFSYARRSKELGARHVVLLSIIVLEAFAILWAFLPMHKRELQREIARHEQESRDSATEFNRRINEIIVRGDQAQQQGDFEKAINCYEDAKTLAPNDARVESILSNARSAKLNQQKALEEARSAVKLLDQSEQMKTRVESLILKGNQHEQEGRYSDALVAYEQALAIDPASRVILNQIARARDQAKSAQAQVAQREHESQAQVAKKQRVEALLASGDAKKRAGAWTGALSDYMDALLQSPGDEVIRARISAVRNQIEKETAASSSRSGWGVDVDVHSMTVATIRMEGGRSVDMVVTVMGGVVRIGHMDPFGKPSVVYYENPSPRLSGQAEFAIESNRYVVVWKPLEKSEGHSKYRIELNKAGQ